MNYWTYISNKGIRETDSPEFQRKILMTNRFTFVCTICAFLPIGAEFINGNYWFIPIQITVGILAGLSYYLSSKRRVNLAISLVFPIILLSVFYNSLESPGSGFEYTLIPLGISPLSYFENKKTGISLFILTFIAFLTSHLIQTTYVPNHVGSDIYIFIINVFTSMVAFALSAFLTFQLKIINANFEIIINEQKVILENRNKDITDSINYAKRIQQAQLPIKEDIISSLPQSFILFKPKDLVSGDFYFFHTNPSGEKLKVFIAVADCTGHGVPGAFMSIIGSEKLKEAVSQSSDTSEILKLLNQGIKISLHQSESDESTRDGMDIALCSIDLKNKTVKYSGAHIPIWIIRQGQKEVEEIKATKRAIGGLTIDDQHFETHEIKLQIGDTFYISSDGFADTFGGPSGKKVTTRKFKEILLEIQDKSMEEQEKHLNKFIENWKSGTEQMDDILVIGIKI